ncbi:hypothetical protein HF394_10010 [Planococcus glaciei]|uniref:Uncharacterized protein n=1 Tax=Planococcus glaciei TaxID=459472 RepID=A0A7H8QA22_9BACL|nr:hypothetical protein [Planococcus glaciei]QDY45681.1 hypothetical protein FK545_10425 [Planococcus glaciei]QKX50886.1 hypothetical protein HF394_10010 [Planococcus glaciei]
MKEESSKVFLKNPANIVDNNIFQYLKFLIPLVIMTVALYYSINFEVTWPKLLFQVIVLFMIPILSWGLSKVTIRITENYGVSIHRGVLYFLTILFLGVIYMFTSLFMLLHIVSSMVKQGNLSWFVIIFVINSLVFALVHIRCLLRAYYKDIENEKIIVQAIMFIIIFCYGIPALFMTLSNAQLPGLIPDHYVIVINMLLAGGLSVSLQGFKNGYNNSKGTILFANYLQDFFALLIVLAALDLTIENSILFYIGLIFCTLIFTGWRSHKEITKK